MFDNLFKPADMLQKGLSAAWTRDSVIRNNIANVETPGFKASDVEFESLLAAAVAKDETTGGFQGAVTNKWHIDEQGFRSAKTNEKHIDFGSGANSGKVDLTSIEPQVFKREDLSMRMDENNVDIEDENVKLAQNSLYYNTLMEKMNSDLRRLRMAINEGR